MSELPPKATWISVSAPSASIISTLPTRLAALGAQGVKCSGRTPTVILRPAPRLPPATTAPAYHMTRDRDDMYPDFNGYDRAGNA